MAFLLEGWLKAEEDDISELPQDLRGIYVNPWKVFGFTGEKWPWELRDAFRQRCLQMSPHFVGLQAPGRHDFRQVLFAYRVCTGELTGPAGRLSESLDTSPLLQNTNPWDILNTLRPLTCKGVSVGPNARASKMLAVQLESAAMTFGGKGGGGGGGMPRVSFTIQVSYCMRNHRMTKCHSDFEQLHARLSSEMIILPCFPDGGGVVSLVGGKQELGRDLCGYVQRVHTLLAQRGVFSPRVMEFLEVDFGRVHIEEEGRVVSENLDSKNLLPDTCWQVVEEAWLVRWRKFVLGRAARRYHAPGEIDNRSLLQECAVGGEEPANSGGGDGTRRRIRDGGGGEGDGAGGCAMRASPRHVLHERAMRDTRAAALARIETARTKRRQARVTRAALFTQVGWRRKKGYAYQMDKLKTQQHIQDVFEKADNSIREPPKNKPMVVREVKSIVNIGGSEDYEVRFDEETGLDIGLRQRGGQFRTGRGRDKQGGGNGGNDAGARVGVGASGGGRGGEQTIVFEVPPELCDQVKKDSVLLAINDLPVTNFSHRKTMAHIRQAAWPLVLRFRLPLEERDVFSLAKIADMRADGRFSEDVVLEHLKRKLLRGQKLLRFQTRKGLFESKPYLTLLSIDEHNLYYQGRDRVSQPEASRRAILLYDLKFATKGKTTAALKKGARRLSEDVCFSVAAEGRMLDFAVPATVPDDGQSNQRCDLLVWGLKRLIHEMQGSQVYVDKDGAVKRRVRPKEMLTTVYRHPHRGKNSG